MTKTVKISLIVLVAIAGLITIRILFVFSRNLDVARAENSAAKLDYEETNDYDHDGLSNADEEFWGTDPFNPDTDGDGFFDGEEVLSGHDPKTAATAGGTDSLAAKSKLITDNLTEGMANLIVSGLMAGDLKNSADDTTFLNSTDTISSEVIYSALANLDSISIPEDSFNLANPDPAEEELYKNTIDQAMNKVVAIYRKQPEEITNLFLRSESILDNPNQQKIKGTYLGNAAALAIAYQNLQQSPVPKKWASLHNETLLFIKKAEMHYRSIGLSNNDPLKIMVVISNLQTVYADAAPLIDNINAALAQ